MMCRRRRRISFRVSQARLRQFGIGRSGSHRFGRLPPDVRAGSFEVGDDCVGHALARQVQIGVAAELALGRDATHRSRNEAGDLVHPVRVHVQTGERFQAGCQPAASPRLEFGGRARVEPFEFGGVARQRGAQILNRARIGCGEAVVERVDDACDSLPQRCRRVRGNEHVGPSLRGAVQNGGPQSVRVAELVLHGTPGGPDLLGDPIRRHRPGVASGQRLQGSVQHVLARGIAAPVGALRLNAGVGHPADDTGRPADLWIRRGLFDIYTEPSILRPKNA